MAGVWNFGPNGVFSLDQLPKGKKVLLVHTATKQVVSSYTSLEQILGQLGWERYNGGDPVLLQFHKPSKIDLISLPMDFSRFCSVHMYDIVVKCPNTFHVQEDV